MHRIVPFWGYFGTVALIAGTFELGPYVSAVHTVIETKPSPGDPKRPAWPLLNCNGEELVKQSDEEYAY